MKFTKMHGLGNDFILVNCFQEQPPQDLAKASREWCQRHFSIGADGLILLYPPQGEEDFIMRMFNVDGTEAEMCGNGIRCVAMFAWQQGFCRKEVMTVKTGAGLIRPQLIFDQRHEPVKVKVDMGEPHLRPAEIPVDLPGQQVVNVPVDLGQHGAFTITGVSMGNPHCVCFVPDVDAIPLEQVGPLLERHPLFPAKTNVEFVQVLSPAELKMRVWERGCGVTLACGTGACATGVAAVLGGFVKETCTVALPGGKLEISWQPGGHVLMTGPAAFSFTGEIFEA